MGEVKGRKERKRGNLFFLLFIGYCWVDGRPNSRIRNSERKKRRGRGEVREVDGRGMKKKRGIPKDTVFFFHQMNTKYFISLTLRLVSGGLISHFCCPERRGKKGEMVLGKWRKQ